MIVWTQKLHQRSDPIFIQMYIYKKNGNTRVRSCQIRALVDDDDGRGGGVMVEGGQ